MLNAHHISPKQKGEVSIGMCTVQTLSDKPNFAVDIRSFLSGGNDPDDAIDHLDRLASAIATTGKSEMCSDDTTESWNRRGGAQAMAGELITVRAFSCQ